MSSLCRELITIHCGNYANYIGSQWWSLQEVAFHYADSTEKVEKLKHINPDVTHREGRTLNGDITYTPRAICLDYKENIGNRPECDLYQIKTQENNQDDPLFHGKTDVHKEETLQESWTKYLSTRYHPKSLISLNSHQKPIPYQFGYEVYSNYLRDIEDSIYFFIEECDSLQGVILMSDSNSFGGLSEKITELLKDEIGVSVLYSMPIWSNIDTENYGNNLLNNTFNLSSSYENSSSILPISPQSVANSFEFNLNSKTYIDAQTSSIIASLIDTTLLPIRRKVDSLSLIDHLNNVNVGSKRLHSGFINYQFVNSDIEFSLSPQNQVNDDYFSRLYVQRGNYKIPTNRREKLTKSYQFNDNPLIINRIIHDLLETTKSFELNIEGLLINDKKIGEVIQDLISNTMKIDYRRLPAFSNIEKDILTDNFNSLKSVIDTYEDRDAMV